MTTDEKPTTVMLPVVMSSTADVQALSEQVRSFQAEVEQLKAELKSKRDELAVVLVRCGPKLAEVAADVEITKREQAKVDKLLDGLRFLWAAYMSCAADRATLTHDEARLRDHLGRMEHELLTFTGLKQL